MADNRQAIEQFRAALESGDMERLAAVLREATADDFVEEWPQSGERIRGRAMAEKLNEGYQGATGNRPKMSMRRLIGEGDLYVAEGTIDYGDGIPVSYVGIIEMRDGKVRKMTEYFANPFEAPAWRAGIVERMDAMPVG